MYRTNSMRRALKLGSAYAIEEDVSQAIFEARKGGPDHPLIYLSVDVQDGDTVEGVATDLRNGSWEALKHLVTIQPGRGVVPSEPVGGNTCADQSTRGGDVEVCGRRAVAVVKVENGPDHAVCRRHATYHREVGRLVRPLEDAEIEPGGAA